MTKNIIWLLCLSISLNVFSSCNVTSSSLERVDEKMNYNINDKNNYVGKIAQKFTPPQNPKYTVIDNLKKNFERDLGVSLPHDYYDYLNTFGDGSFSEYFQIIDPFVPGEYEEYFEESKENRDIYYDMKNMRKMYATGDSIASFDDNGDVFIKEEYNNEFNVIGGIPNDKCIRSKIVRFGFGFPFDFYNDGKGLVYWGCTDDFNFFWNFYDNNYTIVMYGDSDDFYEYDMSFSEFVYSFLNEDLVELNLEEPFVFIQND